MAQGGGSFPDMGAEGVSSSIHSASAQQGEWAMTLIRKVTGMLPLALASLAIGGPALAADKAVPAKLDAAALAGRIDQAIQARLDAGKLQPSPRADDAEFLRRVYLDITGAIPTAD